MEDYQFSHFQKEMFIQPINLPQRTWVDHMTSVVDKCCCNILLKSCSARQAWVACSSRTNKSLSGADNSFMHTATPIYLLITSLWTFMLGMRQFCQSCWDHVICQIAENEKFQIIFSFRGGGKYQKSGPFDMIPVLLLAMVPIWSCLHYTAEVTILTKQQGTSIQVNLLNLY